MSRKGPLMIYSTLLHENLRVIRNNISVNHWPKGNMVASWLDVLINQLLVMFPLEAQHQLNCVLQVTPNLAGQHSGIFCWLKTDSPAWQSGATLGNGSLEEACEKNTGNGCKGGLKYIWVSNKAIGFHQSTGKKKKRKVHPPQQSALQMYSPNTKERKKKNISTGSVKSLNLVHTCSKNTFNMFRKNMGSTHFPIILT